MPMETRRCKKLPPSYLKRNDWRCSRTAAMGKTGKKNIWKKKKVYAAARGETCACTLKIVHHAVVYNVDITRTSGNLPLEVSKTMFINVILMTMETRCSKVIFPNYWKKKPAEDTLVPPLLGNNVCSKRRGSESWTGFDRQNQRPCHEIWTGRAR